jgi:hypothetical protein
MPVRIGRRDMSSYLIQAIYPVHVPFLKRVDDCSRTSI